MQFFSHIVRNVGLRIYAREHGCDHTEIRQLIRGCQEDHIKQAEKMSGVSVPVEFETMQAVSPQEAVGGGLLQKIIDWIKSDQGQQFIKTLFTILIAVLPLFI